MRHPATRKSLSVVASAAALAVVPGTPARADLLTVVGSDCGFASISDPDRPDRQIGYLKGGPITVADPRDPATAPVHVTVTCTLQVGGANSTHAGADAVSASASGVGVAVLPHTLVSYAAPEGEPVYSCTQVTVTDVHGTTRRFYRDSSRDQWEAGYVSTDPGVPCREALCQAISDRCMWERRLVKYLIGEADAAACRHLGGLAPGVPGVVDADPTGDVHVAGEFVWDCPPYSS